MFSTQWAFRPRCGKHYIEENGAPAPLNYWNDIHGPKLWPSPSAYFNETFIITDQTRFSKVAECKWPFLWLLFFVLSHEQNYFSVLFEFIFPYCLLFIIRKMHKSISSKILQIIVNNKEYPQVMLCVSPFMSTTRIQKLICRNIDITSRDCYCTVYWIQRHHFLVQSKV